MRYDALPEKADAVPTPRGPDFDMADPLLQEIQGALDYENPGSKRERVHRAILSLGHRIPKHERPEAYREALWILRGTP